MYQGLAGIYSLQCKKDTDLTKLAGGEDGEVWQVSGKKVSFEQESLRTDKAARNRQGRARHE
jgi:hypothetical protein